ncbi:ParB N-terminal domain-containing protein [Levilactobacillus enshiensis]|uniref:ParB N-terminal domain-containing protein n=1 Tax=Levilactobacillus enshiensis TaxID=2590213 RepID=UPI001179D7EA|nr:ParB N-terminal domain-containing protein [Levilactobacillus enshiensis]
MNNDRNFQANKNLRGQHVGQTSNVVYKTDKLSIFQLSEFNRTVFLKKEMVNQAKVGLISPIIVNEDYVVIDGQHRLAAAKKAGVPIEYIIKPGLNRHDIVRMNTIQRPWGLKDYIEAYANQGKEQYILLSGLIEQGYSDVTSTISISIGLFGNASGYKNESVKKGNFEFKNYGKTVTFLKFYERFRKETNTPKRNHVCVALNNLCQYPKVDKERLIKKVVSTGLSEEIKVKAFTKPGALKALIDAYNQNLPFGSEKYLNYHVTSNGTVVVDESLDD